MNKYWLLIVLLTWFPVAEARESSLGTPQNVIDLQAGDDQGIQDLLSSIPNTAGVTKINLHNGPNGETVTTFRGLAPDSQGVLPNRTGGHIWINGMCQPRCTLTVIDAIPQARLMQIEELARVELDNLNLTGYGMDANGGVVRAIGQAELYVRDSHIYDNYAGQYGGGFSIEDQAKISLSRSLMYDNEAGIFGDHLNVNSSPPAGPAAGIDGMGFNDARVTVSLENPWGNIRIRYSTIVDSPDAMDSIARVNSFGDVYEHREAIPFSADKPGGKTKALCNDFGSGAFKSEGYNIASDNSCALDQDTDLPSTDSMLGQDADGFLVPMPGSPAIDSGASDVVVFEGETLASLPCGHRDAKGTARPQDANGDGVFECDRGAIEIAGSGAVVAGHSSVFYNPDRDGEGNYVEVLEDGRAVVYTFTYNPDGTGPAWFLGVGQVSGNSIILDDLFRPTGTPFGDDFDAAEVDFTNAGSMSMVFPDCQASAPGGNIAYTGDVGLGYEGLISRGTRLANITGCGAETPDPNAGLSGSWYDPARNGEGLIVEWLTNGDVLAVFFTYDTEGNQFWLFGQATPNGKSVTMNAVYPSAFTPWGRNFNPADVVLDNWGTFTLNWTDCANMTFQYSSSVGTFGSATRNYSRLSKLAGTTCPAFP